MGLNLLGFTNGVIRSTYSKETSVEGIWEKYCGSKENGDSFLETTYFEVSEDGVGYGFGAGGLSLGLWIQL